MRDRLLLVLCVCSMLMSIVAICAAFYRSSDLGFDYQGILVGVLSLLVTVLIGWNIYTVIDFRSKADSFDRKSKMVTQAISDLNHAEVGQMATLEGAIASVYYFMMGFRDASGLEYHYINHSLLSLYHLSVYGNIGACSAVVKALLETIINPENITVSKAYKNDLLLWMNKIEHAEQIDGFSGLMEVIARIGTKN